MKIRTNTRNAAEEWVNGILNGRAESNNWIANSCHSNGLEFYSYNTLIAFWGDGAFHVNCRKYSVTTSKLQTYIKSAISAAGYEANEYEGKPLYCW